MKIPSKFNRAFAIVGFVIGMLVMTDTRAYGRTRVSVGLRTAVGDVYIESGHRHYRHYYGYPGYYYGSRGYYYYGSPRYYYRYPYRYRYRRY